MTSTNSSTSTTSSLLGGREKRSFPNSQTSSTIGQSTVLSIGHHGSGVYLGGGTGM